MQVNLVCLAEGSVFASRKLAATYFLPEFVCSMRHSLHRLRLFPIQSILYTFLSVHRFPLSLTSKPQTGRDTSSSKLLLLKSRLLRASSVLVSSDPFCRQYFVSFAIHSHTTSSAWQLQNRAAFELPRLGFVGLLVAAVLGGEQASDDPFDGHTLEWAIPSPAPVNNFAELPLVNSSEPVLDAKPSSQEVSA